MSARAETPLRSLDEPDWTRVVRCYWIGFSDRTARFMANTYGARVITATKDGNPALAVVKGPATRVSYDSHAEAGKRLEVA